MIDLKERREVYYRAIAAYGARVQMVVALEELSEAQKEICKVMRGDGDIEHLAEEIADAAIMLEQMTLLFFINGEVKNWIDKKVQRLEDRLERGNE